MSSDLFKLIIFVIDIGSVLFSSAFAIHILYIIKISKQDFTFQEFIPVRLTFLVLASFSVINGFQFFDNWSAPVNLRIFILSIWKICVIGLIYYWVRFYVGNHTRQKETGIGYD